MDKLHNSSELRYNIKARIEQLTRKTRANVRTTVLKDSGMCKSSYYKALALKHKDESDIPAKLLLAFSKALNVKMEKLFNKGERK